MKGWIGVDLDGTLAHYSPGSYDHRVVGEPIPAMLFRVQDWLARGCEIRIFTARLTGPLPSALEAKAAIDEWCLKHLGRTLPITASKDYRMIELWDDRAIQVEFNTGRRLGPEPEGPVTP